MGPCMCGDPYCGSCGDPAVAAWEEFSIECTDRFQEILPLFDNDGPVQLNGQQVFDALDQFLEENGEWMASQWRLFL